MSKVTEFLQKQDRIIAEDREKTLISLGLFEKEYAPDGKFSRRYQKYDIINGEKRYYREAAIEVSDEEWQSILEKTAAVAEIEKREALAFQKEHERKTMGRDVLMPNFKEEGDTAVSEKEAGRSRIATALRIAAVVMAIVMIIAGMVAWANGYEEMLFSYLVNAVLNFLLLYALAEILSYLAVLTAIAKGGHQIIKK